MPDGTCYGLAPHAANPTTLTLAIALALAPDVVTQKGSQNKVFLGRQLVERARHHQADSVHALLAAEKKVDRILAGRLHQITDLLALQALLGIGQVAAVEGVEHHLADALLVLVDVIHQHLHLYGLCGHGLMGIRFLARRQGHGEMDELKSESGNPGVDALFGLV